MKQSSKSLLAEIAKGKISPVYVLSGEETFRKQKVIKALHGAVVDPSMADFNMEQCAASDCKGVALVDKAWVLPMMADRRFIQVSGCDAWKKKDMDAVTKYLAEPSQQTVLVLDFKTVDRRRKLFTFKTGMVTYVDFPKPKPWELVATIREIVAEMGLKLQGDAVELIAELAGDDLAKVYRELEKLSLYKLGSKQINSDDVAQLMGMTRAVTRWELNGFISKRDLPGGLAKAHDILDSGGDPIGLLSTISGCLRQLFLVKSLMMRGIRDRGEIGRAIGVPPKIAGDLMAGQASYSDYELRRGFQLLGDSDYRLKSAAMDKRLFIDHLLCELMKRNPLAPPKHR